MPRFSFFHLFCFCLLFSFSFQIPSDDEQAEKIRDILKNPKRWDFSNNELSNDKFCYLTKDNNGKYTCNWGTYAESLGRIALIGGVISVTLLVLLYVVWCLRCCGLCGGTGPSESSDGEMGLRVGLIILAVLMLFLSILIFYGNEKFFVGADDSASLALKEADNALATAQNITASINSLQTISVPPSTNATANKIVADLKHYTSDAHDVYDRFTLNSPGRKAICGVVYSICLIIILLGLIGAILINSRITCAFNILGIILLLILWIWMAFMFTAGTADSDLCFDSNYALQGPLNPTQIYLVTFYNCSNSDFKTLINDLTRQKNENLLKFCTLVYPTFCNYPNPNYKVFCNQSAVCLKFNSSSDVTSIVVQEGNKNLTVSQCATQCQDPIIKNISSNMVLYGKDFDTVNYILGVCNKYVDCTWMQDIIRTVFPSACVDSIRGVGYTLGGSFFVSVLLLIAIILSYFAINKFAAKSGDGGHEMSHLSK